MTFTTRIIDTLSAIAPQQWNALAGADPFLRHEFLSALHETGCACEASGWAPRFITQWQGDELCAALPLYLKSHSYGEYVFDWAWAEAYHQHGARYYPKLVCAVPFTPVTGARLLGKDKATRARMVLAALAFAKEVDASSLHILFPCESEAEELKASGMLLRQGLQFRWENRGYARFDDFLAGLNHAKRKKIRQERRKVDDAGITFEWRHGADIDDAHWEFFNRCYRSTYRNHHSTPYLNLAFFRRIGRTMPANLLLVVALREGSPIAAALNLRNEHTLYGRYWGSLEYHSALHFETCYYQAIEYCIAHRLRGIEGGAQGEHKLARGFLPMPTWSAHWLAHPRFAAAIGDYLARETRGVEHYLDELKESSPFRNAAI